MRKDPELLAGSGSSSEITNFFLFITMKTFNRNKDIPVNKQLKLVNLARTFPLK
jgi:hypothetical protein